MVYEIFIIKFAVAVFAVLGLSILFEKVSPKIAGILSGYPAGTAITLFFFGFENGAEFASESAVFNIVGLFGLFSFIYIYYRISSSVDKFRILSSVLASVLGFFAVAFLLNLVQFTVLMAVVFSTLSIFLFTFLFRKVRKIETGNSAKQTSSSILGRAVFTGAIIVIVTTAAEFLGPGWAGLLSSFPTTVIPLMLMIHYKYTTLHVHALVKHIPDGSFSLILYSLSVFYFYPIVGIYWGTVIAYAVATAFIFLLYGLERIRFISRLRQIIGMVDQNKVHVIMTGGSIDSQYDKRRDTVVPNKKSTIPEFMDGLSGSNLEYTEVCMKDSRTLSDGDFKKVLKTIEKSPFEKILITMGTYKLSMMAEFLRDKLKRKNQTIVITASSTPLIGFSPSEAPFNLGYSLASAQKLPPGIYVSFNGELFTDSEVSEIKKLGDLATIFKANPEAPVY